MTPANEAAFLVASVDLAPVLIPAGVIVAILVIALLLDHHGGEIAKGILPEAEPVDWAERERRAQDYMAMHAAAATAKKRTERTRHRMNEEAWKRASGQDIA